MNSLELISFLQRKIGSADFSKWHIQRWCYWDYVRYPAAGANTPLQFFVNPIGSTDPVSALAKTFEQTNIPQSRTFGQTYTVIAELRTHVYLLPKNRQPAALSTDANLLFSTITNCMDEIYNIIGDGVLNLFLGQKQFYQIQQPFRSAPPGFGVHIYKHAVVTEDTLHHAIWLTQSPHAGDIHSITPYQLVEPNQPISCNIEFPEGSPATLTNIVNGATPAIDIGVILDGYTIRPAQ